MFQKLSPVPNRLFDPNGHVWSLMLAQLAAGSMSAANTAVVETHVKSCLLCQKAKDACDAAIRKMDGNPAGHLFHDIQDEDDE